MNLGLQEHVALVTGSSQGIGRSVALQFAEEGAYVAVTYHREKERAEALIEEIRTRNGDGLALFLDLASFPSIANATHTILDRWGRIDILVNNAMHGSVRPINEAPPFEEVPPEEWQSLLRVNIEGTFRATQLVIPCMRARKWGRIVNVSSAFAEDGSPRSGWYSTVKSSLHGLTRSLAKELGPSGILVNSVMPGLTATERLGRVAPALRRYVEATLPIRTILRPEDIASTIVFLSSKANSAITGEIVRVSGGRM